MSLVVQSIDRVPPETLTRLGQFGVATIHEAQGRTGLLAPTLRPLQADRRIAGAAVTVSVAPGDNWMIHVAVEQCRPGDIMVVSPTSACDNGYFGDLLATLFMARGIAGLVIDAGVRDVAELRRMGFPVWSKAISAQGTVKETLGSVNIPLACGGQIVHPGDAVIADDDGIVIVPRTEAEEVAAKAQAREEREAKIRARYQAGELGLDMNNMRPALTAKGLKYI